MPDIRRLARAEFLPVNDIPLKVVRVSNHLAGKEQHMHEFGELVVITGGSGTHWVEDQRYQLTAGDIFVILENTRHTYQDTRQLGLINLLFDADALRLPRFDVGTLPGYQALFQIEPRVRQRRHFSSRLRLELSLLEELLVLVSELERELRLRSPGYQYAAVAHWMQIVIFVARAYSDQVKDTSQSVIGLSRVLSHLERHLEQPHTVEELARVAGMSSASLFREFEEIVGCPPIEHLLRLRIDRAKRLLRNSNMRIGEISAAVGFEDSNYFARQFRQHVGVSPRGWRDAVG